MKRMKLKDFFETMYVPRHSELYKRPASRAKDRNLFYNHLGPLLGRKLKSITREEIALLHRETRQAAGLYTANRALTLIAHIYAKALEWGYPERLGNPARGIRKFRERPRDRFIHPEEMRRFFRELAHEPNAMFRHYILLSLFLGQRRRNILALRWDDIDLATGRAYFADTKNGEAQQVPLTLQARELLGKMRAERTGEWVLPSRRSKSGHFEEPKELWRAFLKRAGIQNLRLHDLRRTMGSYQAITGSPVNIIGKALGHRSAAATMVYSRLTLDPVRESMQRATDKMLEYLG